MKFQDGFWVTKPDFRVTYAEEAYHVEAREDSVRIFAVGKHIHNRGDTLDGVSFDVICSSPMPNVIKVSYTHFKGAKKPTPDFEEGDFIILRLESIDETNEATLVSIEDDDEFDRVADFFEDLLYGGEINYDESANT